MQCLLTILYLLFYLGLTLREVQHTLFLKTLQAIAKCFATPVFTSVSEHVAQMGFYHLKNDPIGHRSDKTTLSVSTACPQGQLCPPTSASAQHSSSILVEDPEVHSMSLAVQAQKPT
jgi:hypothetical protein